MTDKEILEYIEALFSKTDVEDNLRCLEAAKNGECDCGCPFFYHCAAGAAPWIIGENDMEDEEDA